MTRDDEIVVFSIRKESTCAECGDELGKGSFLRKEGPRGLCLECADLDHLVFLPSGDTALTRRARKLSRLSAVVVRWIRSRGVYGRRGLLVEEAALQQAEQACLEDSDARERARERAAARRTLLDAAYVSAFAEAVHARYPGCPEDEARGIAEHACQKYSGRVGRTAAAKEFAPRMIDLAVRAHVRHVHTGYDELLADGEDRITARQLVEEPMDAVLKSWGEA